MKTSKSLLIVLALMLAASAGLAACGGGDSAETGADEGAAGEGDDAASDGGSGDAEQVLNINIKTEPPSLHPGRSSDTTSSAVQDQIFEGLTRMNMDGEPEEAMASEIDISDDGLTYTFTIREEANWSNGDPVTAEDFEYAWKWVLDPDNADTDYAYQLYPIKNAEKAKNGEVSLDEVGVKAVDEKTLEVTLENPTAYFLELTAFHTYYPVNKEAVLAFDGDTDAEYDSGDWALEAGDHYVTNGPFIMTAWEHQDHVVLEKNEDYWDADTVQLEKINMYIIEDENTELNMYKNGELDWAGHPTGQLPLEAIPALKEEGELIVEARAGTYYYAFNVEEEPFNNENIRKAFALAINRQGIVENITKGEQLPATALVPPTIWEENESGYFADNDIEQAKAHLEKGLDELGYSSVDELPQIMLSYNTDEAHAVIAQAVQDMWKNNLGVENVELDNTEWKVYLDMLGDGNFQVGRMGWIADFNDAINFLEIFETIGGNNYTNWEDPEYQELLKQSREELDDDKRKEILKEAEQLYMDVLPIAPVYFYTNVYTHRDYVHDVDVSPLGNIQFKWAYMTEKE